MEVAKRNAHTLDAEIEFIHGNILDPIQIEIIKPLDFIISNPPYIPEKQRNSLEKHVRDYEPDVALFVPDNDPIVFYKALGNLALKKLKSGGALYVEIHPDYAKDIMACYSENGFLLELRKDFSGNNRMIKAHMS